MPRGTCNFGKDIDMPKEEQTVSMSGEGLSQLNIKQQTTFKRLPLIGYAKLCIIELNIKKRPLGRSPGLVAMGED